MANRITLPGLIDPHVHLRDPGQGEKEDFYTGTQAAIAGGFTTILDMPNNLVPITSMETLEHKIKIAKEKIICDVGFYFGSLGNNLHIFQEAVPRTFGLKLFLNHTTGNYMLDPLYLGTVLKQWPEKSIVLFHAETETFGLVLDVLKKNPRPIHLCHLSTKFELELVMKAKEEGLPVTCGVTPHHLFLTESDESSLRGFGMMKPPLRPREDVDFLWKNLAAIDCIESDHAPHTKHEKEVEPIPFGVTGLETTLPLLLTAVYENRLSLDEVKRLCHDGPQKIFRVPTDRNTSIELDLETEYEIKNENLFTKCKWSPFNGWKVKGKVAQVKLRNKVVYDGEKILSQPGSGFIMYPLLYR